MTCDETDQSSEETISYGEDYPEFFNTEVKNTPETWTSGGDWETADQIYGVESGVSIINQNVSTTSDGEKWKYTFTAVGYIAGFEYDRTDELLSAKTASANKDNHYLQVKLYDSEENPIDSSDEVTLNTESHLSYDIARAAWGSSIQEYYLDKYNNTCLKDNIDSFEKGADQWNLFNSINNYSINGTDTDYEPIDDFTAAVSFISGGLALASLLSGPGWLAAAGASVTGVSIFDMLANRSETTPTTVDNDTEFGIRNQYSEADGMALQKVTFSVEVPPDTELRMDIDHTLPVQDGDPYTNTRFRVADHLPEQHGHKVTIYGNDIDTPSDSVVLPYAEYNQGTPEAGEIDLQY